MNLEELEAFKKDVNGITIDGPSGIHFKKAIIKLIDMQIERESAALMDALDHELLQRQQWHTRSPG